MTAVAARTGMPLAAHLREARSRAVRAGIALAVGIGLGYALSNGILDILREPIEQIAASRNASLNFDSLTGAFDLRLKIALIAGIVLSSPAWLYELLAFLGPGLTRREKTRTAGFLTAALPLFLAGCTTGLLIFPHVVEMLTSFASTEDSTILQASAYVGFALQLMLATGVAFTLPVVIVVLNVVGILSGRTIARSWRIWTVAIVLFSALATPAADVLSMFLVAVPLAALFAAAMVVALVHDRRLARASSPAPEIPAQEEPCSV